MGKGLREDFGRASVSVFGINALRGRRWDGDVRGGLSGPRYRWASGWPTSNFSTLLGLFCGGIISLFHFELSKGEKKLRNAQLCIYIYVKKATHILFEFNNYGKNILGANNIN